MPDEHLTNQPATSQPAADQPYRSRLHAWADPGWNIIAQAGGCFVAILGLASLRDHFSMDARMLIMIGISVYFMIYYFVWVLVLSHCILGRWRDGIILALSISILLNVVVTGIAVWYFNTPVNG